MHRAGLKQFKPSEISMLLWGLAKVTASVGSGGGAVDVGVGGSGGGIDQRRLEQRVGSHGGKVRGVSSSGGGGGGGSWSGSYDDDTTGGANIPGGLVQLVGPGAGGSGFTLVPPDVLEAFKAELAARAGAFGPRDIALSAWALATLNPQPDRFDTNFDLGGNHVETSIGMRRQPESAGAGTRDGGVDGAGDSLPAQVAWLVPVEAAAVARISEFNPQDFSNLIWAFAKLNHFPGARFQAEFEEAALGRLRDFSSQTLANTAYAYAALNLPGAVTVLPFVSVHLSERLGECQPKELVMVLWAYARCSFDPGPDTMAGMEAAAMASVDTFLPDELTHYLWAAATLRYRPSAAFLTAAERRMAGCPAKFGAESVTLTLWVYATLGLAPGRRVLERFGDELEGMVESDFKPQDLSLGFWSAAVLVTQPRQPSREIKDGGDGNREGDGDDILEGGMREGTREGVLRGFARLLPSLAPDAISREGLCAVFMATLALNMHTHPRHHDHEGGPDVAAASNAEDVKVHGDGDGSFLWALATELRPSWAHLAKPAESAWREMKTLAPTVSKLQEDVGDTLRNLGVAFHFEQPIKNGLVRPDFILTGTLGGGGKDLSRIVVEVDGPHHYSKEPAVLGSGGDLEDWFGGGRGGGGGGGDGDDVGVATPGIGIGGDGRESLAGGRWPLGSTVLRNQLLHSWGWTVVTVPYHQWEQLVTAEDKMEYVGGLLTAAV